MKRLNATLISLFAAGSLFAQVQILEEGFMPSGVSNDGLAVGHYGQNEPFYLWHTDTNTLDEIGGMSAGNGVGGDAKFSADGKYICGSMMHDWSFSKEWEKNTLTDYPYTCNAISRVPKMTNLTFAVGENEEGKGVILSTNDGRDWNLSVTSAYGLEAIHFLTDQIGITCGKKGVFAYTTSRGMQWTNMDPRPEGNNDEIASYKAIDFTAEEPYFGVIGAELAEGGYTAYQSANGGETWSATTGVTGVPLCITHTDEGFFMGTQNGKILKSADNGITWEEIFTSGGFLQPVIPIYKIKFANEKVGIATTDAFAYRTIDGGKTWKINRVDDNMNQKVKIYDIVWQNEQNVIVVGSQGVAYSSADAGATWTNLEVESDKTIDFRAVNASETIIMIGGVNGNFYNQTNREDTEVSSMGRYSVEDNKWTALGNFGFINDGISMSSAYAISGDGKTVVGLSSMGDRSKASVTSYAHAAAWSEDNGFINLGSRFSQTGRSTRADAVSYDGSVVVGWQDEKGPWHAAVWYRNENNTYDQNEYIAIDPSLGTEVSTNRARAARAVSLDGTWVGGSGSSIATGPLSVTDDYEEKANQPWIWSKETGLMYLGMLRELEEDNSNAIGHVTGINNDGTVAVGFFIVDKFMYAFIWTKEGGILSMNDYLKNIMHYDLKDRHFASVLAMSHNGRYISGWGLNDATSSIFAFQTDLLYDPTGIRTPGKAEGIATVYPNPVSDVLHIDLPFEGEVQIRLIDVQGRVVMQERTVSAQNTLPIYDIEAGLYILEVTAEGIHKTCKIKINH